MEDWKRHELPGQEVPESPQDAHFHDEEWSGLRVVATPIGNLGDLSSRARSSLSQAEIIFCEDTRRTRQLLTSQGIRAPRLERLDAHATSRDLDRAAEWVQSARRCVYVSDAGTPGVSDPVAALVARLQDAQVPVSPIPGPSAVAALLSVSGFSEVPFAFRGFFPRGSADQSSEIQAAAHLEGLSVVAWFESPERIVGSLKKIGSEVPDSVRAVVGKELTKRHEKLFFGTIAVVAQQVEEEIAEQGARGEWCFVLRFPRQDPGSETGGLTGGPPESANWDKALALLLQVGVSVSEASKRVSQAFGVARKQTYENALKLAGQKKD